MVLLTLIISLAVAAIFSFVIAYGAPFIPTQRSQVADALKLLDLKPGQTLLELGSGDGRMLRAAAKQGIHAIGYELNPLLVWFSRLRNWRYRHLIQVHQANYWRQTLPECDAVYVFLMRPYMARLGKKLAADFTRPTKVVSLSFAIPDRRPRKTKGELYLYDF